MTDFRNLISAVQNAQTESSLEAEPLVAVIVEGPSITQQLTDLVEKLRSYTELAGSNDFAKGVETGLKMAATMVERVIRDNEAE